MALTQVDKPFSYTRKGQRLYVVYTSTNSGNTGFKFGFQLTEVASGKSYQLYISPDPQGRGVFDMSPLVNLRHQEEPTASFQIHAADCYETDGNGFKTYDIEVTEWWIVNDVFTQNEGVTDTISGLVVTNSYFQPFHGYKPDTINPPSSCNYSWRVPMNFTYLGVNDTPWYAYSDRTINTSAWNLRNTQTWVKKSVEPYVVTIFCRWDDLGCLTFSTSNALTGNALDHIEFTWVEIDGTTFTNTQVPLTSNEPLVHVAAYPGSVAAMMPANTAYYYLIGRDASSPANRVSAIYLFVNEELQGNWKQNCNYSPIRLGWVNSRGGWDYWNFQLKSERTTNIERKQYNSVLKTDFDYGFTGTDQPFYAGTRMLTDRSNLNTTSLLVTTDWISEDEFIFLRSLLTSNQVQIIDNQDYVDTGCYRVTPVTIEQSTFTEKKDNDGKLHNLSLNLKYSQPYWGL
jgi:hypothetical protein